jgi:TRAP-type C4-dicarboxylate transport system permease small subunit
MAASPEPPADDTPLARALRRASVAVDMIGGLIFLVLFATIIAQTVMRYVFRNPLTTSQELASVAFIWMVFWTIGASLRIADHVRFDLVYEVMPEGLRRACMILCNLLFLGVFVWAIPDTLDYFGFLASQTTASMRLSYQVAFLPYFLFFVLLPLRLALNTALLVSGRWRSVL